MWELDERRAGGALLSAEVELDPSTEWLMRCDRVDFPPGGVAYRHTHPGPGIRCLLFGRDHDRHAGDEHTLRAGRAVVRARPRPGARDDRGRTSRRRSCACCCCRPSGRGSGRSATSIRPTRRSRRLQRATIFLEQPVRAVSRTGGQVLVDQLVAARRRPRLRRAGRELPRGARRAARRADAADRHAATRAARRTWPRPTASSPAARASASSRAAPARRTLRRRAHRLPGLDADDAARRPGGARARSGARPSRSSTTARCSGRSRSGRRRSTTPRGFPEIVARAFAVATSGRPGPVVLALPEDMLTDEVDVPDARPHRAVAPRRPASASSRGCASCSRGAERPLVDRRRGRLDARGRAPTSPRSPRRSALPVGGVVPLPGLRRQRARRSTPATSALGMDPKLAQRVREADVLLASARGSARSRPTGYTLVAPRRPTQRLVHVHPDPDELGRVYQPELGDRLRPRGVRGRARARCAPAGAGAARRPARGGARRVRAQPARSTRELPGALQMSAVMATLRERLPADAILTNGAGNFTVWAHRFYEFHRYPTQLAPAQRRDGLRRAGGGRREGRAPRAPGRLLRRRRRLPDDRPGARDRRAVGARRSSCSSSTTACTARSACTRSATIPGRVVGTDLRNPDFAAYARAFGAHGALVERTEDFAARSTRRSTAGGRRCSSCASTRRRSRRARRSTRSGRPRR